MRRTRGNLKQDQKGTQKHDKFYRCSPMRKVYSESGQSLSRLLTEVLLLVHMFNSRQKAIQIPMPFWTQF